MAMTYKLTSTEWLFSLRGTWRQALPISHNNSIMVRIHSTQSKKLYKSFLDEVMGANLIK